MEKIIGGLLIGSLFFINCSAKQKSSLTQSTTSTVATQENKVKPIESNKIIGTVLDKSKIDGCSYVISINDSTNYEPINLEKTYQKDGLKIMFTYKLSRAMTACMMGQPIVIQKINLYNQKTK